METLSTPIINTGVQPTRKPPTVKPSSHGGVPTWWIIVSLLIVVILTIGLIVAVFFNYNVPLVYESNCPTCCNEISTNNTFLECYSVNEAKCRENQLIWACDIENTSLISGPFLLISTCQSSQTSVPAIQTLDPTSILTIVENDTLKNNSPTLSLKQVPVSDQNTFFLQSTLSIDVHGKNQLFRQSNFTEVLTISTNVSTVEIATVPYDLYNVVFFPADKVPSSYTIPEVHFIGGQITLATAGIIGGFKNFKLIAVHSEDTNFSSIFTVTSPDNAVILATPQVISQSTGTVLNTLYPQTTWTPYYVFDS